jgi:hypothetical protein
VDQAGGAAVPMLRIDGATNELTGEEVEVDLARKIPRRPKLLSASDPRVQSTRCTTVLRRLYPPRSTGLGRPLARGQRARRLAEGGYFCQNTGL